MFFLGLCRGIFLTGSACFSILLNVLSHVEPVDGVLGSAKSGLSTHVPGVKSLKVICSQGTRGHYLFPFVYDTILQPQRFPKVPVLPGQCWHIFPPVQPPLYHKLLKDLLFLIFCSRLQYLPQSLIPHMYCMYHRNLYKFCFQLSLEKLPLAPTLPLWSSWVTVTEHQLLAAPSQGCMTQPSRIFEGTVAFAVVISGLPELTFW